ALPRLDHREVGADALFEHVLLAVEDLGFLAVGELGARRGARVEAWDAGAAGAQLLGERALRRELQVELAGEHLALELLVLADVRGDHLLHLAGLEQEAHAEIVHPGVVADDGEAFHRAVAQRGDEILGNAAQAEAAGGDGDVVAQQPFQGRRGVGINLLHWSASRMFCGMRIGWCFSMSMKTTVASPSAWSSSSTRSSE